LKGETVKNITRTMLIIFVVCILFTVVSEGRGGVRDGSNWNTWSNIGKYNYLLGFQDSLVLTLSGLPENEREKTVLNIYPMKKQTEDVQKMLDEFYKQDENTEIPITFAIQAVAWQKNGREKDAADYLDRIKKQLFQDKL